MQIKYIKDAPLGKTGDIAEVADSEAQILITLGYAEEYKDKPKPKATTTKTATKDKSDSE